MADKQYVVAEYRPIRTGLIPVGYHWDPILDTNDIKIAFQCQQNWSRFTGHKTVIIDFKKQVICHG